MVHSDAGCIADVYGGESYLDRGRGQSSSSASLMAASYPHQAHAMSQHLGAGAGQGIEVSDLSMVICALRPSLCPPPVAVPSARR